jgi:hypothetical protein
MVEIQDQQMMVDQELELFQVRQQVGPEIHHQLVHHKVIQEELHHILDPQDLEQEEEAELQEQEEQEHNQQEEQEEQVQQIVFQIHQ